MDSIPAVNTASTADYSGFERPRNIQQASEQFESLMITQMLKTARESGSEGWLGTDEDDAGAPMMDLAEQNLAQVLASHGGLGLAHIIAQDLEKQEPSADSPSAAATPTR